MFENPESTSIDRSPLDGPSIERLLTLFANDGAMARHPATLRRFAATRTRLLAYLATDAQHALLPAEQALLNAERQFAPDGAFARVFGAEVLLCALPGFLQPSWLPRSVYDARTQIRFVELLCDWTVARRYVDAGEVSCMVYGVSDAARAARAFLRGRARAADGAGSPAGQGA